VDAEKQFKLLQTQFLGFLAFFVDHASWSGHMKGRDLKDNNDLFAQHCLPKRHLISSKIILEMEKYSSQPFLSSTSIC